MALEKMFSNVVPNYDILNHIITFGLDDKWRRKASMHINPGKNIKVLDLGSGTGDLAFRIEDDTANGSQIIALDFSENMVKMASEKKRRRGSAVHLVIADVAALPMKSNSIDIITTSFSFRNLVYKNPNSKRFLTEIHRVLTPKGRFVILESSQPGSPVFRKLFQMYARRYVPFVGGLVSGDKGAYRYLGTSMANFYGSGEVKEILGNAGFKNIEYGPLSRGVAGIHVAEK